MFTLLAVMLAALLAPAMLVALGIWLLFAVVGLVFKLIGWTIRVTFSVFGWLFLGTLLLGVVGVPALAVILAICAFVWGCSHVARA
ncbi:MAG: hypothetical protein ACOYJL_05745 [Tractidigestivibacter sp.]|jgi:hypothetical protein|uniref:hypothetical protein n=1 Tax=Tractidigestivibacter sp. TaxID=2847320 RepID=UPI003D9331AB